MSAIYYKGLKRICYRPRAFNYKITVFIGQVVTIVLGQVVADVTTFRAASTDGSASELCADND